MTQNSELLKSFADYCKAHPKQRFWQALRNWSGWEFIYAGKTNSDGDIDIDNTFYWREKRDR